MNMGLMLHHISFGVQDLILSGAFYDAALGALGFRRAFEDETAVGYGLADGEDDFCLKLRPDAAASGPGFHLAFAASSRAAVDAFHQAALQVGGQDNGAPGLRPDYGPLYYAAFLIDPDGHRIEVVTKTPPVGSTPTG
jgi:catechol 2,3-dioxygenase-like lactoylglutathione lyase family enzyme